MIVLCYFFKPSGLSGNRVQNRSIGKMVVENMRPPGVTIRPKPVSAGKNLRDRAHIRLIGGLQISLQTRQKKLFLFESAAGFQIIEGKGDAALWSYSWSANESNNVGRAHYYTKIGGTEDGMVNLPDGTYLLKAATYCTRDAANVNLYASLDNVNMKFADFNGNESLSVW